MVDTVRTVAALQTLLADNTTGAISAQDLRDMLVSVVSPNITATNEGWKDNVMPLNPSGVPASSAPTLTAFGSSGNRKELAFAVNDYCFVSALHINHDIKVNGDAYLHVHWSTNGTSTNTVKWEFEILRAIGHNQANFGSPATITVEQAAAGTAWRHMVAEVATGDKLTLTEPDELILVTLKRVTNGGTENADTVYGLTVDMHYQSATNATLNKSPDFYS